MTKHLQRDLEEIKQHVLKMGGLVEDAFHQACAAVALRDTDDIERMVADGRVYEQIIDGVRIQMRSILLTSGTTIVGLLPLLVRIERSSVSFLAS